jgi:hypothetical protein
LYSKEFFNFFSQSVIFKGDKRLHGLVADEGEIAEVFLGFDNGFIIEAYLEHSAASLSGADQILVYFPLCSRGESGCSRFDLRL